jgi:hypothetical protein
MGFCGGHAGAFASINCFADLNANSRLPSSNGVTAAAESSRHFIPYCEEVAAKQDATKFPLALVVKL